MEALNSKIKLVNNNNNNNNNNSNIFIYSRIKMQVKIKKHKPSLKNGSSPRALLFVHSAKISTHNDKIRLSF